jgi:hypothetical protein
MKSHLAPLYARTAGMAGNFTGTVRSFGLAFRVLTEVSPRKQT